jgi:hypothetical protein
LCDRCHNIAGINNDAHSKHGGYACYNCHIVVPHGGALQGLVGDRDGNMPSRYAYNNNKNNLLISGYSGGEGDSTGNCNADAGCSRHNFPATSW